MAELTRNEKELLRGLGRSAAGALGKKISTADSAYSRTIGKVKALDTGNRTATVNTGSDDYPITYTGIPYTSACTSIAKDKTVVVETVSHVSIITGVIDPSAGDTWEINGTLSAKDIEVTDYTSIIDKLYPVGCIYMSYEATSPAELFGGSWTQLTDVFLRAANDTSTGGSDTHSHVYGLRFGNFMYALCAASGDLPAVVLWNGTSTSCTYNNVGTSDHYANGGVGNGAVKKWSFETRITQPTSETSSMPKYQDVYCWRRVA